MKRQQLPQLPLDFLHPIVSVPPKSFAVPWESDHCSGVDFSILKEFPAMNLRNAGHSETEPFKRLVRKQRNFLPIEHVADPVANFNEQEQPEDELEFLGEKRELPDPVTESPDPELYCYVFDGAFMVTTLDSLPENLHCLCKKLDPFDEREQSKNLTVPVHPKRKIPFSQFKHN